MAELSPSRPRVPGEGAGAGEPAAGGAAGDAADVAVPELLDLGDALERLDRVNPMRLAGRVSEVTGLLIRATVPGIRVGELVWIENAPGTVAGPASGFASGLASGPGSAFSGGVSRVQAEVVGFRGDEVVLMPLGEAAGIGPDSMVTPTGRPLSIQVGDGLLGRVLDGLGEPIDGAGPLAKRRHRATGRSIAPRPIR